MNGSKILLASLLLPLISWMPAKSSPPLPPQQQTLSAAELKERAAAEELERQELVNLEKETVHALELGNSSFFRRVYSDDFLGTGASGQLLDKTALVDSIERSNAKYSSFIASDIRIRIFQDTAVVTALWSARGISGGRGFDRQYRVTHIYLNGLRGWKAVAGQETLLPG
jgi:Domain of unknown function (DUF4440)